MTEYQAPSSAIVAALKYVNSGPAAISEACRIAVVTELNTLKGDLMAMAEVYDTFDDVAIGIDKSVGVVDDRLAELEGKI